MSVSTSGPRSTRRSTTEAISTGGARKTEATMPGHTIVSREKWLEARKAHLAREKEFTRLRDQLSADRRALPWVRVDKTYVFEGPAGKVRVAALFRGRRPPVRYPLMFGPGGGA